MKSSHRRITALIFLLAILIQVFLPVYPAYAVIDTAAIAATGASTCIGGGAAAGLIGGALADIVGEVTSVPTHDSMAFKLNSAIYTTTAVNCISNFTESGTAVKESFWKHVLDVAAYAAINVVLQTITRQIIGWIKGTDSGFVQNLQAEALRTADAQTGALLNELTGVNLCGNIGAFLKLSIGAPNAAFRQRLQCSVTGIVGNFQNFYDNFANGGWPAFFSISLEPQNNAYGAFLLTANEQFQRQSGAQQTLQQKLIQGSGFKGFEVAREANCQDVSETDAQALQESTLVQDNTPGAPKRNKPEESIKIERADDGSFMSAKFCDVQYDTKTPGKLFADALPTAAFSGVRRAELANTVDQAIGQIVFALLQRIIKESVGGGKGLFGASDIGTPPTTTLADAGFRPTYLTNQTDDSSLRLEAVQLLLDAKIQGLDTQIAAINIQIAALQKICTDTPPLCDQKQIDKLTADKAPLEQGRATAISLLTRTRNDLAQILDLRTRMLTTTDIPLLENLGTKLTSIQADAEQIIQQAGGPPTGQNGVDADDNFVRIADNARDRATAIVAYLEKRITAEIDPIKKAALMKARDDLKKLADDLSVFRTAFLDAIAKQIGTAGVMTQITGKIGEINDKILSVYSL